VSTSIGKSYDRTAGRYDDAARNNAEGGARLIGALPDIPVDTLLDAGCGTGFAALCALERFGARRVIGVDLSAEMIARFGEKLASHPVERDLRVGDITEIELPAEAVDLALCSMALHWISDRAQAVASLAAALRPGGYLGLLAPGPGHDQEYVDLIRALQPPIHSAIYEAFARAAIPIEEMEGYLEAAGLEPVDIWVETRRRKVAAERYIARMTTVGRHVTAEVMNDAEHERTFARIQQAVEAASGPRGFEYTFTKTYAVARKPGEAPAVAL
jgi:SAM-dependent methyltransferase